MKYYIILGFIALILVLVLFNPLRENLDTSPSSDNGNIVDDLNDGLSLMIKALDIIKNPASYKVCKTSPNTNKVDNPIIDQLNDLRGTRCSKTFNKTVDFINTYGNPVHLCGYIWMIQTPNDENDYDVYSIVNGRYPDQTWTRPSDFALKTGNNKVIEEAKTRRATIYNQIVKQNKTFISYYFENQIELSFALRLNFLGMDCIMGSGFEMDQSNANFKSLETQIENKTHNISDDLSDVFKVFIEGFEMIENASFYNGCELCAKSNDPASSVCVGKGVVDKLNSIAGEICDKDLPLASSLKLIGKPVHLCSYFFIDEAPSRLDDLSVKILVNGRYPSLVGKKISDVTGDQITKDLENAVYEQAVKQNKNIIFYKWEGQYKFSFVKAIKFLGRDCIAGSGFHLTADSELNKLL